MLLTFDAEEIQVDITFIIIKTQDPPSPVPLTIGTLPVIFCPPQHHVKKLRGKVGYCQPRMPDPCAGISTSEFELPTHVEMYGIVRILDTLMNCQEIFLSNHHIMVVLVHGDGREYNRRSLPGIVTGRATTYYHDPEPFFSATRNPARKRILDPQSYLPEPTMGPLPQDGTNYLDQPAFRMICPGVRVSSGHSTTKGEHTERIASTTCGIRVRKGTSDLITVANHGFLDSVDVYHPDTDGEVIGQIEDRYPELDVAMVRLNPSHLARFQNKHYFQAEPPRRLGVREVGKGKWFEVDGMSSGLVGLYHEGTRLRRRLRAARFPPSSHTDWSVEDIYRIFGAVGTTVMDGMCGAPIVQIGTGAVAGFFHVVDGDGWAISATLDDLIAEGYDV